MTRLESCINCPSMGLDDDFEPFNRGTLMWDTFGMKVIDMDKIWLCPECHEEKLEQINASIF